MKGISDSEFNMWRAVFAFSLLDNFLSLEEQKLLRSYKAKTPFSKEQLDILSHDFERRQDIGNFYNRITDAEDRKQFCVLARALTWSDGSMGAQEKEILKRASCLDTEEGREILQSTRDHPHLKHYYQSYSKAGVVGLFSVPHQLDMVS
ncbi:MAG: hypothetical protein DI586_00370 [Micavibrio aeruginosavorus]|uniref:Co-chaperone DjlA N-terminal domain-containing protein n=1 Tax=Micavibrio aeruginosavorus TaxID=349221 RepID=A0A2W5HUS3_9BACT|nr:MAG: hypothetical protein DI586_00370 [Micavibrio aeruginosavorus]